MKRAVISTDYLFYLTNHDQTHTSLWGCRFEQWLCTTVGPRSFTRPLLLEWRSPEKCSQRFTKGNTQFSHNEIQSTQREASLSFFPSHGESLLSPFLHASYTRHKLLNPRNTVLWDSAGAFCRGSEVESGIFHCAGLDCHPRGSRVGRVGWGWGKIP